MKDLNWLKETVEKDLQEAKENKGNFLGSMRYDEGYLDGLEDVSGYIGQVEQTRKIEVPDFVDLWMKENSSINWWRKIAQWEDEVSEEDRRVNDWYQEYNENDFIIAWITKEYTVVKEKSYFAKLKDKKFPKSSPIANLSRPYYWAVEEALGYEEEGVFIYPTPVKTMAGIFKERDWKNVGIDESNADLIEFVGEIND